MSRLQSLFKECHTHGQVTFSSLFQNKTSFLFFFYGAIIMAGGVPYGQRGGADHGADRTDEHTPANRHNCVYNEG